MIRFQDRRGIGSLCYRIRAEHAEITVLWREQKPVVYSDMDFLPVYELSVVLWTQPWGRGVGRLYVFPRFTAVA